MEKCKAIIVDDEPPAREVLLEYLDDVNWVEVVGSFGNPRKAVSFLKENQIDVLFLDIQMPKMTGFEMVNKLDQLPDIIFSTAYDEYAIRAFDINAVDYLLKPYTKERFRKALEKVKQEVQRNDDQQMRIQALLQQIENKTKYPNQLFVRSRDRIIPIQVDQILWIEAEGDYSRIHLEDDNLLCGLGLGKLLEQLDPKQFTRVHRSHATSLLAIRDLHPNGYGGFTATLNNGTEVKISRSYADSFKKNMI